MTVVSHELTAVQVRAQVNLIQEVMQGVMKKDTHYGVVPGCGAKPTLLKPGAEKLMATFRIAVEPVVTDLSTPDSIRYRVEAKMTHQTSGCYLGSGVGECSTDEEKFKWRSAASNAEFNATTEDRRRIKYLRDGKEVQQVRTNPADLANTVLKMAKKRALVDGTLTVTAASDIFTQDIEELPDELRGGNGNGESKPATYEAPKAKSEPSGDFISEAQCKRLYAIWKHSGKKDEDVKAYIKQNYGIETTKNIKKSDYEAICAWAEGIKEESKSF